MHLWNVRQLAIDLRAGQVAERQQLFYVLAGIVFSFMLSDYFWKDLVEVAPVNDLDGLSSCLSFLIWMTGTIACYKISKQRPGRSGFLVSYTCLAIPTLVQIAVVMLAVAIFLILGTGWLFTWPAYSAYVETVGTTGVDVVILATSEITFFVYLWNAFRWSYA